MRCSMRLMRDPTRASSTSPAARVISRHARRSVVQRPSESTSPSPWSGSPGNALPRAEFREGDAQALPFPDRCFDAVVSNLGLPHFGRPEQAVAEFRRVLTDEGRLALTAWNFPARARLVGVLLDAAQEVGIASPEVVLAKSAQRAEERPVEPAQRRAWIASAQHGDLDTEHQDLDVLGCVGSGEQPPAQHTGEQQIGEPECHSGRSCCAGCSP
jgi:SAM-dependent methyltransferase